MGLLIPSRGTIPKEWRSQRIELNVARQIGPSTPNRGTGLQTLTSNTAIERVQKMAATGGSQSMSPRMNRVRRRPRSSEYSTGPSRSRRGSGCTETRGRRAQTAGPSVPACRCKGPRTALIPTLTTLVPRVVHHDENHVGTLLSGRLVRRTAEQGQNKHQDDNGEPGAENFRFIR